MSWGSALLGGSAVSDLTQGFYQANVARNNAIIAQQNANQVSVQSQTESQRLGRQAAQVQGEQEAAQAGSGIDVTGSTATAVRASTAQQEQLQSADTINQGTAKARGYLQQSADFRGQANMDVWTGVNNAAKDVESAVAGGVGDGSINPSMIGGTKKLRYNFSGLDSYSNTGP